MDEGRRRAALAVWLANDLPARFARRMLPIDHAVAEQWGNLMAQSRRSGVALSVVHRNRAGQRTHTLVTRKGRILRPFDVPLFNPWEA